MLQHATPSLWENPLPACETGVRMSGRSRVRWGDVGTRRGSRRSASPRAGAPQGAAPIAAPPPTPPHSPAHLHRLSPQRCPQPLSPSCRAPRALQFPWCESSVKAWMGFNEHKATRLCAH